ncbi:MAG TPA: globin-coupled sensor protein [Candidatus Avamphibacillus sp.]|nr:globin-coupled sensor protein [Candidatus Avamphibacillus sp.]
MFTKLMNRNKKIYLPEFTKTDLALEALPDSTHEIMKLIQLTQQDIEYLHLIDDLMEEHAPVIAERHYHMLMEIPELKQIFNTYTTYERYVPAITNYFKQLTKPELDHDYVEYRKKIGRIHSRIQLTEEWFIGSYMRVYEYLIPFISSRLASKPQELANVIVALNRIITFDTILVLEAYEEANDFLLIENVSDAMDAVTKVDEVGNLLSGVEQTTTEANEVNQATQQLNAAVEEIASTASNASERTKTMVEQAGESKDIVESSLTNFLAMIEEFQQSKENFKGLTDKVNSISEVIDFIKSIADETNLLALNASIEAARAGEHGLGFAVVADEVRKLAEQTKTSVENITTQIEEVQHASNDVNATIEELSEKLSNHVEDTNVSMKAIEAIMEHIDEVKDAINTIAMITEQEADATEEISSKMSSLNEHFENTKHLTELTGKSVFKAAKEVNEIRQTSLETVTSPTEEQQDRINQTEDRVTEWFDYNKANGFSS